MSPQGPSLSLPCMALPSPQVPPGPAASLTEPAQVSGGGPSAHQLDVLPSCAGRSGIGSGGVLDSSPTRESRALGVSGHGNPGQRLYGVHVFGMLGDKVPGTGTSMCKLRGGEWKM